MILFRFRLTVWILIFLVGLMLAGGLSAAPMNFKINSGLTSEVLFISKAPLGTFEGVTDQISGEIRLDPELPGGSVWARFEVNMASLETGNKTRDQHLHNNHLHTQAFPTSSFFLTSIEGYPRAGLPADSSFSFQASGNFTLHGLTREVTTEVVASWRPLDNELEVQVDFIVQLSDFEIPRPQFLVFKLDEEQRINVRFIAQAVDD